MTSIIPLIWNKITWKNMMNGYGASRGLLKVLCRMLDKKTWYVLFKELHVCSVSSKIQKGREQKKMYNEYQKQPSSKRARRQTLRAIPRAKATSQQKKRTHPHVRTIAVDSILLK